MVMFGFFILVQIVFIGLQVQCLSVHLLGRNNFVRSRFWGFVLCTEAGVAYGFL
jgi:hypothetical protein